MHARGQPASSGIVTISTRIRRHAEVLSIAERFPQVYCSIGTHPHHAHEELDITVEELIARTRHPKVVAIGEAGLDYHYELSTRGAQEQGFRNHIDAARKTGLPLVIHSREADADMKAILTWRKQGREPFLPSCTATPAGATWRSAPSRSGSSSGAATGILTFERI